MGGPSAACRDRINISISIFFSLDVSLVASVATSVMYGVPADQATLARGIPTC